MNIPREFGPNTKSCASIAILCFLLALSGCEQQGKVERGMLREILRSLLLIDSHAHLDSERYADDREAMLRRAWEAGVGAVLAIGIGEQADGMDRALEICRQFNGQSGAGIPRLYASAGVYPHNTHEIDDAVLAKLTACWPSRR
jgi:hypothetical protein